MNRRSVLLKVEPPFRPVSPRVARLSGSAVASWLTEPDSLTRRIRSFCGSAFRVHVLGEHWLKPFRGEAAELGLHEHGLAWIREVALYAGPTPVVLARTVIPRDTLSGRHSLVSRLGTRPLGEWLFANRGLRRLSLEAVRVNAERWRESAGVGTITGPVWGRRSLYAVARDTLLVSEFFLPELIRLERHVGRIEPA
ncbi:MAG: chorismate lyase [Methylotetracoccus sp.]